MRLPSGQARAYGDVSLEFYPLVPAKAGAQRSTKGLCLYLESGFPPFSAVRNERGNELARVKSFLLRRRWLIAGTFSAALAIGTFALADALRYPQTPTRVQIDAAVITSFDNHDETLTRFGSLEFRGRARAHLASSGFRWSSPPSMSNRTAKKPFCRDYRSVGRGFCGRIVYRDGKPAAIADAEMAPIALGPDGKPLAARGWYDAERSLTERDGMLYIGIERVEQIVRFDYRRDGLRARGQPITVPPDFKTFAFNKSLECLATAPGLAARDVFDCGNRTQPR